MIKKLRLRLIAVSMLSLFSVLLVIVGAVNIFNYQSIVNEADSTLFLLAQNDGRFPLPNNEAPFFERGPEQMRPMSPELPYESRFFWVITGADKSIVSSDTSHIAAVDQNAAAVYAQRALRLGKISGFTDNYRFFTDKGEGFTRIIFLDCTRSLSTFRMFLLTSCVISLLGLFAVFVLIVLLSKRIVQPISESYEKQKQFITDAGHELKTPITIIDADVEVLQMEVGENEWISDIRKQTKRLAALTGDLIYLSRMQEESLKLCIIDFPISDIVAQTAQSFHSLALTQHKDFAAQIQPNLSFCGDEKAIRQLSSILLDNALKYSGENGIIRLALYKSGKNVVFSLTNTVTSLPQGNLNRLFDRFYRADPSRNSQIGGHGIGLSIAKAITVAHKGKISAVSPDGKSLTITVTLPT